MIVFLALALMPSQTVNILFVGNSLLNYNDVPATVVRMLQSDGAGRRATSKAIFVGHLEDVAPGSPIDREVTSGRYDFVVLQGASVSSSRTRTYAQTRAIAMAKAAKARASRVLLMVEWPRRGIDETEYTLNVYRGIQKRSGAELVPVCRAWNSVATRVDPTQLWSPDGNHAQPGGSFVAASCLYFQIAGVERTPTYVPQGVSAPLAARVLAESRKLFTNRTPGVSSTAFLRPFPLHQPGIDVIRWVGRARFLHPKQHRLEALKEPAAGPTPKHVRCRVKGGKAPLAALRLLVEQRNHERARSILSVTVKEPHHRAPVSTGTEAASAFLSICLAR